MTSQSLNPGRRGTVLGTVIGTVLASFSSGTSALEFETETGTRVIWNTAVSVGSSWRAEEPSPELFTKADGSLIGIGNTLMAPGTRPGPGEGLAGNQADSGRLDSPSTWPSGPFAARRSCLRPRELDSASHAAATGSAHSASAPSLRPIACRLSNSQP